MTYTKYKYVAVNRTGITCSVFISDKANRPINNICWCNWPPTCGKNSTHAFINNSATV